MNLSNYHHLMPLKQKAKFLGGGGGGGGVVVLAQNEMGEKKLWGFHQTFIMLFLISDINFTVRAYRI